MTVLCIRPLIIAQIVVGLILHMVQSLSTVCVSMHATQTPYHIVNSVQCVFVGITDP